MPEITTLEHAIQAHDLVKVYPGRGRRPPVRALDGLGFTVPVGHTFGEHAPAVPEGVAA